MKKILGILTICILTLVTTGCGNKELEVTCSNSSETMIINYKNNKMVKFSSTVKQIYNSEFTLNAAYQATELSVNAYNAITGVTASVEKNENSIILKVNYDVTQMDKDIIKESEDLQLTPNKFIDKFTKAGYTCK